MQIDWIQVRRVGIGVGTGFLIGGIFVPMIFPQYQNRIVTEFTETVKTVEKEKIVIQEKEKIVWKDKIVKQKVLEKSRETLYSRDGSIHLIEKERLTLEDSYTESGMILSEKKKEEDKQKTTETAKTITKTEQTEKARFGLGLTSKFSYPYVFDYKDLTVYGYANVAGSGFWLQGGYSYPLTISLGGIYLW